MAIRRRRIVAKTEDFSTQEQVILPPQDIAKQRRITPAYVAVSTSTGKVYPEAASPGYCEVAETKKAKNARRAKEEKLGVKIKPKGKLRKCHVELQLIGSKTAAELNTDPGAYLMACTKFGKPGTLIPVRDPEEASAISRRFCACRDAGSDVKSCATQVRPATMAGARRRRK